MKLCTLCYIERDGCYLMLHRVKKKQDVNAGKWIGVGGKLEYLESPDECIAREVMEETGLTLKNARFRGIVSFFQPGWDDEMMFLFTGEGEGSVRPDCDEGILRWVPIDEVEQLNLWAGDRVFLRLLRSSSDFFSLKLVYSGEELTPCVLNGQDITQSTLEDLK
jgi:8-oxo-dGTP diphosphatase